ncbi:MAG: hypothetical protein ABIS14_09215, partial [Sphingomonas sp.]
MTALAAGIPALGQDNRGQNKPESILPPGFNDPVAQPTASAPAPAGTPNPGATAGASAIGAAPGMP